MEPIEGEIRQLAVWLRDNTPLSLRDVAKEVSETFNLDVSHEWVRQACKGTPREGRTAKTSHKSKLKAWRGYNRRIRLDAIEVLGSVCTRCGFDDVRVLQIDHIEGGGTEHRKRVDHKLQYRNIRDGQTAGYQLLCPNCHGIKSYEEREARYEGQV